MKSVMQRPRRPAPSPRGVAVADRGPRAGAVSASERAYHAIRSALLGGQYPIGARLTEEQLVRDLDLSRTPVREAVKRLESEFLLRVISRTGLTVPMPTIEEFDELCELRAAIDGLAARAAALRATASQRSALTFTHDRMTASAASGPAVSLVRSNIRFHEQLLEASQNRRLVHTSRPLIDAFQILATGLGHSRVSEMLAEHAAILEALEARDAERAERAARQHIERAQAFYARHLMDLPLRPSPVADES